MKIEKLINLIKNEQELNKEIEFHLTEKFKKAINL